MLKRSFDFMSSLGGLIILSIIIIPTLVLIWLCDFHFPLYLAPRMRKKDQKFTMVKLRTMVVNADQKGGTSTAGTDKRLTWIGSIIRKFKIDEFTQLWNVMVGDMSLVGPRPQTQYDSSLYTNEENRLFDVRPGITDIASIVFSDEGEILKGASNPDLNYNQLIRPWKSRLGMFYVEKQTFILDVKLIFLTLITIFNRPLALKGIQKLLKKLGAEDSLISVASREFPLKPTPPPGSSEIENRY